MKGKVLWQGSGMVIPAALLRYGAFAGHKGYLLFILSTFLLSIILSINNSKAFHLLVGLEYLGLSSSLQFHFLLAKGVTGAPEHLILLLLIIIVYIFPFCCLCVLCLQVSIESTLLGIFFSDLVFFMLPIGNALLFPGLLFADAPFTPYFLPWIGLKWGGFWLSTLGWLIYRAVYSMTFKIITIACVCLPFTFPLQKENPPNTPPISVGLFAIEGKTMITTLYWMMQDARKDKVDYWLLPEGLYTLDEREIYTHPYQTLFSRSVNSPHAPKIIIGAYVKSNKQVGNEAIIFSSNQIESRVKEKRVPFSEYIPLEGILGGIRYVQEKVPHPIRKGKNNKNVFSGVCPLICYELFFPDYVCQICREGAQLFFVVSSNSYVNNRHLEGLALKAMQVNAQVTCKPFIRCTDHGISAFINSSGRIMHKSMYKTEYLHGDTYPNEVLPFYVKRQKVIDFIFLCTMFILLLFTICVRLESESTFNL